MHEATWEEIVNLGFTFIDLLSHSACPLSGVATANHCFPFQPVSVSSTLTPTTCMSSLTASINLVFVLPLGLLPGSSISSTYFYRQMCQIYFWQATRKLRRARVERWQKHVLKIKKLLSMFEGSCTCLAAFLPPLFDSFLKLFLFTPLHFWHSTLLASVSQSEEISPFIYLHLIFKKRCEVATPWQSEAWHTKSSSVEPTDHGL